MKKLKEMKENGYIFCLPQYPKIDAAVINRLQGILRCQEEPPILHVISAREYLSKGTSVVDDNGDIVTILDSDLNRKLVVIRKDLNLWYSLMQERVREEIVCVELSNPVSGKQIF